MVEKKESEVIREGKEQNREKRRAAYPNRNRYRKKNPVENAEKPEKSVQKQPDNATKKEKVPAKMPEKNAVKPPEKVAVKLPEKKSDGKVQKSELRTLIVRTVEQKNGMLKKKDLFDACLLRFNLTAAEKRDRSPESKWTNCRSVTGLVIAELVAENKIVIDSDGFCHTPAQEKEKPEDPETALKEMFVAKIPQYLTDGKKLTKREILLLCVKDCPKAKPQSVRCEGGKALSKLKEDGKISQDKKTGAFYLEERFPNTPLGKTLRAAYEGADVKKCLIDALNLSGGPFFETFSVELLTKEFSSVGTVEKTEVTGGPDDGGVDGKIVYRDHLGFRETVLLQAKLRNVTKSATKYESGKQITLKEVREFYGAAIAAKGTRFVWITTTTFCKEAKSFIEKQSNFVGIDKKRLCELAIQHGLGIVENDGKIELDYKKFS